MALLLDGKACSKAIEQELQQQIQTLQLQPKLVMLLVGSNPDSKTYTRLKQRACQRVGIIAEILPFADVASFQELHDAIERLNADASVCGVLLQLPLPQHLQCHEQTLLHHIVPSKDVDGLHPHHLTKLLARPSTKEDAEKSQSELTLLPCTPAGCLEILTRHGIEIDGKDAVVIGRGQLVGMPLALMLLQRNATVTVCHSHTPQAELQQKVQRADLVFVATGQPGLVRGDWIKPGAAVVDVGISYVDDAGSSKGYKILGDVAFEEAKQVACAITPVPGGIGPMTIAMLLQNVVASAKYMARAGH